MISPVKPGRWFLIAGALMLLYFALDAILSVRNVERLQDHAKSIAHSHEVAAAIEGILSDLKDVESGQRGYLITGDTQYLEPYSQALARIEPGLQALGRLVAGDARQEASLAELRGRAEAKLGELATTIQLRRDQGFDAARRLVTTNAGKRHMDAMRAVGEDMIRRETEALDRRQVQADASARSTTAQIIISDALGAIAIIAFVLLLRRHLAARDEALAEISMHRSELQVADRRKDEFLATLAHELRNPLAPLSNSLFILAQRDVPPQSRERALATLQRQVRQMVRLIDDLLDVGRIRLGKLALSPRTVRLADVVDQAVETVAPMVQASRHRLAISMPEQPVYLDADPIRLAQVISNLLNNAAKFTPPEGEIALSAEVEPGWVNVRVVDNGAGIDPARLDEIFGLFAQLDQSVERQHSGLGIGLALVKRLVELHGGTVRASSEGSGRGSQFTVRLPIVPAPAGASDTRKQPAPSPSRAKRVLVVDDNRDGADTLATMVRLMGHEARAVNDGEAALASGAEWRPDLVILDIGMPGMSGYETCAAMRATPWGRHALIVALTGWGQEQDRRRAEAAGFDRHLVKPASAETLRALCDDLDAHAGTAPATA